MNKITADLFPMRVNPQNFKKGDVVKKIYMDNISTPYVGIVTAVIPSTNKVEVQWPDHTGLEDPWDLIKVNPILNPPVVKEDKAYDTYQKRINSEEYLKSIQPYTILTDYINEHLKPILLHASDLYNEGYSKAESYKNLTANFDNKDLIKDTLNKIYNDNVNVTKIASISLNGDSLKSKLIFKGNSDFGFKLSYDLGSGLEEYFFDNYRVAFNNYKKVLDILKGLSSQKKYASIVSKVIQEQRTDLLEKGA